MEGFCRGCLIKYNEPMELLQYTEKNRRLFVYSTGLQVKRNDTFTFQLCKDCFLNMKLACKFKKQCRTSDKRFRNYVALKDVGDPMDFCTFLKNSDDTLTFRLPMTSGNSTPATQKCRDDDNESTCTSIRNFMTDILQGEEMPDTEARIIKEVIEEEADLLDDSLDSHWMQDDMSIDTDFRLDFSFSPFSTPHTVNNDRCYTPKQTEEQETFDTLDTGKQSNILNDFTNVFKTDKNITEHNVFGGEVSGIKKTESFKKLKEICPFSIELADMETSDGKTDKSNQNLKELCDFGIEDIDSNNETDNNQNLKQLCDFVIDEVDGIDNSKSNTTANDQSLKKFINSLNGEDTDVIRKSESNNSKTNQEIKELFNFSLDGMGVEKAVSKPHKNVQSLKELCDFSLDSIGSTDRPSSRIIKNTQSLKELYDLSLNSFEDTARSGSNTFKTDQKVKEIYAFGIDELNGTEKSESNLDLPSLPSDIFDKDKVDTPDFDIPKGVSSIQSSNDISNSSINIEALLKDKPCSIDKNLEEALKNTDNKEYSLEDLLVSPRVFPAASAASTPTIANILFGKKLDTPHSYTKTGQCIEPYYDVQGDIEVFEEFFQNDTKEFYLEDIKRENKFKPERWKKLIDLNNAEVHKEKENDSKIVDMDISIEDKDQVDNNNDDTAMIKTEKETITYFTESSNDKFDIDNSFCKLCDKKYDTGRALSVHFSKTHNIKILKPRDLKINRKYKKNSTAVTEFKNEPVINISDPSRIKLVVEDKFDIENLYCKLCNKYYKTRRALSMHLLKGHNIKIARPEYVRKSKNQVCMYCGEISKDTTNFARHMKMCQRKGMKEGTFKCDRCLEEFSTQVDLDKHKICHTQIKLEKPPRKEYVCTFCGAIIYKHSNLVVHMRRHTKDYVTKCEVCDKGFYRQTDLKVHMRNHTGETPFSCKICPRLFSRRDVLTRHVLAHFGEKLFECDYCNKKHMKKCDLLKHIRNQSCRKPKEKSKKIKKITKKKVDIDMLTEEPEEEKEGELREERNKEVEIQEVTVTLAKGSETTIKKQLPFLETDRSN